MPGIIWRLKFWLGRLAAVLFVASGGYRLWSKLCRAMNQPGGADLPVPPLRSLFDISMELARWKWVHVPWWRNYVPHPGWVWREVRDGCPPGDCSSFAIFAVSAIRRLAMATPDSKVEWTSVYLLTAMMLGRDGTWGAHDLCTFRYIEDGRHYWAHISNWNKCAIVWRDRRGRRFGDMDGVVRDVCDQADAENLGWTLTSHDLEYTLGSGVVPRA